MHGINLPSISKLSVTINKYVKSLLIERLGKYISLIFFFLLVKYFSFKKYCRDNCQVFFCFFPQSKSRIKLFWKKTYRDSLSAQSRVWPHVDLLPGVSNCPAEGRNEEWSHSLKAREKPQRLEREDNVLQHVLDSFFPLACLWFNFCGLYIWCTTSYFFPDCISNSWILYEEIRFSSDYTYRWHLNQMI